MLRLICSRKLIGNVKEVLTSIRVISTANYILRLYPIKLSSKDMCLLGNLKRSETKEVVCVQTNLCSRQRSLQLISEEFEQR